MILGITPARGGSKGIPGKNIKSLLGKPLIAWTIEAARRSRRLDRFVVSTEDPRIARVARRAGAEVLARPKSLATDTADTLDVLRHALRQIPADVVVLLQATSPVRDPGLIDRCVDVFLRRRADSLATGFMCKFAEYGKEDRRRQDMNGFFYDDGNVYVIDAKRLARGDRYGRKQVRLLIDHEQNVEIDDEFDFWLAEKILEKRRRRGKS